GWTALHWAASNGHTDIARVLLSHGALVDDIAEDGGIPLHLAAYNGHLDVLRVLLEHRTVDGSDTVVAQCSNRDKDGQIALHDAARQGHSEVCRVLLDHGALVDATDNDGYTPLQLAEK
ncbi:ankyrin, partial [Peniophora sp. CONT]